MQLYSAANTSLVSSGSNVAETKIPLWWADGTNVNYAVINSGYVFLADGQGALNTNGNPSNYAQTKIFTLSANWPAALKYALESTLYVTSGGTATISLWDITTNTQISLSQASTASTTSTLLRSGSFTLTPGHIYGVSFWTSNTSYTVYVSDASLIVFPS